MLDVQRICHVAATAGGEACPVEFVPAPGAAAPDEFLIASQLLADEPAPDAPLARPLDDGDGWPAGA